MRFLAFAALAMACVSLVSATGAAAHADSNADREHAGTSCYFPDAVVGYFMTPNDNAVWLSCFSMTTGSVIPLTNISQSADQTDMANAFLSAGDSILWLSFTTTTATVNVYSLTTGVMTTLEPLTPGPHIIGMGWEAAQNGAMYDASTGQLYVALSLARNHQQTQHIYVWPSIVDVTATPSLLFDFTPASGFGYDAQSAWTLDAARGVIYALPTYATQHHTTPGDPCESSSLEPRTSAEGCVAYVVAVDSSSGAVLSNSKLPGMTFAYALAPDPTMPDILHCWADTGMVTINVTAGEITATVPMQVPSKAGWKYYGMPQTQLIISSSSRLAVALYELYLPSPFTVATVMAVQDVDTGAVLSSIESPTINEFFNFVAVPGPQQ